MAKEGSMKELKDRIERRIKLELEMYKTENI